MRNAYYEVNQDLSCVLYTALESYKTFLRSIWSKKEGLERAYPLLKKMANGGRGTIQDYLRIPSNFNWQDQMGGMQNGVKTALKSVTDLENILTFDANLDLDASSYLKALSELIDFKALAIDIGIDVSINTGVEAAVLQATAAIVDLLGGCGIVSAATAAYNAGKPIVKAVNIGRDAYNLYLNRLIIKDLLCYAYLSKLCKPQGGNTRHDPNSIVALTLILKNINKFPIYSYSLIEFISIALISASGYYNLSERQDEVVYLSVYKERRCGVKANKQILNSSQQQWFNNISEWINELNKCQPHANTQKRFNEEFKYCSLVHDSALSAYLVARVSDIKVGKISLFERLMKNEFITYFTSIGLVSPQDLLKPCINEMQTKKSLLKVNNNVVTKDIMMVYSNGLERFLENSIENQNKRLTERQKQYVHNTADNYLNKVSGYFQGQANQFQSQAQQQVGYMANISNGTMLENHTQYYGSQVNKSIQNGSQLAQHNIQKQQEKALNYVDRRIGAVENSLMQQLQKPYLSSNSLSQNTNTQYQNNQQYFNSRKN